MTAGEAVNRRESDYRFNNSSKIAILNKAQAIAFRYELCLKDSSPFNTRRGLDGGFFIEKQK